MKGLWNNGRSFMYLLALFRVNSVGTCETCCSGLIWLVLKTRGYNIVAWDSFALM